MAFIHHIDPGHGWLEVHFSELRRLSLNPTDFTRYSYRRGNTFFLEEDCDAMKFVEAWQFANDRKIETITKHGGEFIRRLPSIW
jgi:hypothetical protein